MYVQRDTSGRTKPPVDIDVKVAFYYKDLILKHNFKSMSTGGLVLPDVSPCTMYLIGAAAAASVVDDGELPPVVTEPAKPNGRRELLP